MATEKKRALTIVDDIDVEAGSLRLRLRDNTKGDDGTFVPGKDIRFDANKDMPASMRLPAMLEGIKAKAKQQTNLGADVSMEKKWAAMLEWFAALRTGTWDTSKGRSGSNVALLVAALHVKSPKADIDKLRAIVEKWTPEARIAYLQKPDIAQIVKQMQKEKTKDVDLGALDKELAGLMPADVPTLKSA